MPRASRMPPAPPQRAVRASAARVVTSSIEFQRGRRPWQDRCWYAYEALGEIAYAAGFYARMLGKVELYPAVRSADGQSILRVKSPEAIEVLDRIQDGSGSRSRLQQRYGIHRFVVGESYLAVTFLEDGTEEWEMLSGAELQVAPTGGYMRDSGDGKNWVQYDEAESGSVGQPGQMFAYRLWAPHPKRSWDAVSPLRGVLERCDVLITLGRAIRARGRSRIAGNGLLLISDELEAPERGNLASTGNADENVYEDPVMQEIYDGLVNPMNDDSDVGQVVPVMLRGPRDVLKDALMHFTLADAQGYPEQQQVEQELQRIALGLDMPVEALLGVGGMNHWGAWFVSREAWTSHGQPVTEELANDLTRAYFAPAFDALGVTTVVVDQKGEDAVVPIRPGDVFVWYDESAVVLNPDRAKDSKDAHDRLVISDEKLREELGFNPGDAPSEEEYARRVAMRTPAAKAEGGDTIKPGTEADPATGEQPSDTTEGPPQTGDAVAAAARLAGIAELAVERCRERAGARLRTRLQGNEQVAAAFRSTPTIRLCHAAGREMVESLFGAGQEHSLVAGAADDLLAPRLNGNLRAIIAEVEQIAVNQLYDERVRLSRKMLGLIAREARGQA